MGSSASRIWSDICAIESHHIRAHMIERVAVSPEILMAAGRYGIYEPVMEWLSAYRRGEVRPWPFVSGPVSGSGTVSGPVSVSGSSSFSTTDNTTDASNPRWAMYSTPVQQQQQPSRRYTQTQTQNQSQTQQTQALIVSPAAKALDYFQEALATLGIGEAEELTYDRLKAAYKRTALRVHPDKAGGSKEAFDEVKRAFDYVQKILNRINPRFTPEEEARMTGAVNMETATAYRTATAPAALPDEPPVALSAKKLNMTLFNQLFEEHRLPDPSRDSGYGDWLKGAEVPAAPTRVSNKNFTEAFKAQAVAQTAGTAIAKRVTPDSLISLGGTEIGEDASNFTAPLGSDTQFTDLKEAYTHGATMFQEVAGVAVTEGRVGSVEESKRQRDMAMNRPVAPDEQARYAAAAAALEERERQRRLRAAQHDTMGESWSEQMRRRMLVNH